VLERPGRQQDDATTSPAAEGVDVWALARGLKDAFHEEDLRTGANLARVLEAFRKSQLGTHHVNAQSSGYGCGDVGKEALDRAAARLWGCERAAVRANIVSGTHAITCALFGALRPGAVLLSCTGDPYDTLQEVIGVRTPPGADGHSCGTLLDWGIEYRKVDLLAASPASTQCLNLEAIEKALAAAGPKPIVVYVQRSCGYDFRRTVKVAEIAQLVRLVRRHEEASSSGVAGEGTRERMTRVLVDNCYGEFTEAWEPVDEAASHGCEADLMMGSLIKSPGGTLAPCGGYIAGKADLVSRALARLTVPGHYYTDLAAGGTDISNAAAADNGAHLGSTNRLLLQGLHLAPQAVGEALKSSRLIAHAMEAAGYEVLPSASEPTRDFVTAVKLKSEQELLTFCQAVQERSPVNAYVRPTPGETQGYGETQVVFADGTFVGGSTSEMTCDGPMREPYVVFCQGGTHWTQWAIALENVLLKLRGSNPREEQTKPNQHQQ